MVCVWCSCFILRNLCCAPFCLFSLLVSFFYLMCSSCVIAPPVSSFVYLGSVSLFVFVQSFALFPYVCALVFRVAQPASSCEFLCVRSLVLNFAFLLYFEILVFHPVWDLGPLTPLYFLLDFKPFLYLLLSYITVIQAQLCSELA